MHRATTCLLIDDDADDREIFSMALSEADPGIECVMAGSGFDALEKLKPAAFVPDFIFLDLNMPGMTGRECLKEIRRMERLDNTPVIVYSTSSVSRDVQETRKMGANDYISKPTSISELTALLASCLLRMGGKRE
jgi:CheY-like chemotaxis protein